MSHFFMSEFKQFEAWRHIVRRLTSPLSDWSKNQFMADTKIVVPFQVHMASHVF